MTAVDLPAVPRVLIAEADPWSRDLLKQVLLAVRCDARLDVCGDGQQAATLLREKGLILLSCGTYGNVLRVLVPLTSPDEQLDKGLAIIEECFSEL